MLKGLGHIGIPAKDIEASIEFYEKLGFTIRNAEYDKDGNRTVVFMALESLMIELYPVWNTAGSAGAIDHIALATDDIYESLAMVKSMGLVPLEGAVQYLPYWENGIRYFTVEGPDKEKLEFCQKL